MIDLTSSAFAEHCTWIALCGSMSDPKHLSVFIAQTVTCWQGEQLSVTRHSRDRKIRTYTTILGSFAVVVRFQASTLLVSSHVTHTSEQGPSPFPRFRRANIYFCVSIDGMCETESACSRFKAYIYPNTCQFDAVQQTHISATDGDQLLHAQLRKGGSINCKDARSLVINFLPANNRLIMRQLL